VEAVLDGSVLNTAARPIRLNCRLLLLLLAATGARLLGNNLYEAFRAPTPEIRPFVRWWWNRGRVNATELVRELDVMRAAGIGSVEITTIGMPESTSAVSLTAHPAVSWLSPEWCELVRSTARAAHQRGMTTDLIAGSGWPFGGQFLESAEQTQRARLIKRPLRGPARLEFTRSELEALSASPKRSESAGDTPQPTHSELLFLRLLPADALAGEFTVGRNLLPAFDSAGNLTLEVPAGDHQLYVGIWQMGFTHVKLGATGADGPVVNHFNAAAVRKYLDHMSDRLAPAFGGRLGNAIRATFVDSLELDHANWTGDFAAEFERRRGYDLPPYLPFVLDADAAASTSAFNRTVRRARYDFHRTLLELFDERFLSTYVAWAEANGVKARIQTYGRETHPLHGSMKVHLPEGETWLWLDRFHPERIRVESTVVNKYVSSAANLTGQRLRSFEAMTNAVPVFRETLEDFKRGFDATLLDGLNQPIIHGFNYTPLDAGFPGWVRFGCYLNERTPFWPYFHQFTDYAARLGTVMRASTAHARIAALAEFTAGGGRVVFIGVAPSRAPGLLHAEKNDGLVQAAVTRLRAHPAGQVQDETSPAQPFPTTEGGEENLLLEFATAFLARTGLTPDVVFDTPRPEVSQIAQRDDQRLIYFLANHDARNGAKISAAFPGATGRPYLWDPHTGERRPLNSAANGRIQLKLEPAGSALIVFAPEESAATADTATGPEPVELRRLDGPWQIELARAGSTEREGRTLSYLIDLSLAENDPALRTFGGVATYAIEFDGTSLADGLLDPGEVRDTSEVTLNGVPLGTRWSGSHRYTLVGYVRPGANQLQVKVPTMLANLMRAKVDDPAAQRWANWAPPISAGLIGPVRLLAEPPK